MKKPSLLAQHRSILGYSPGPMDQSTRAEQERMAGLRLEPLPLPMQSASRTARAPRFFNRPIFFASIVFAALVAVIASRQLLKDADPNDRLRPKGESKVWVYWERHGDVQLLESGTALENGDRVRAEVLATEDLVGYLAVQNGNGLLLGDAAQIKDSVLRLKTGEKATFSGSIKLVGANEDERLLVILCSASSELILSEVFPGAGQEVNLNALPEGCGSQEFALRGSPSRP